VRFYERHAPDMVKKVPAIVRQARRDVAEDMGLLGSGGGGGGGAAVPERRVVLRLRALLDVMVAKYGVTLDDDAAAANRALYRAAAATKASARSPLRGCAVYYLSPDPGAADGGFERDAVLSMQCLFKHYARRYGHKVLVFHTMDQPTATRVARRVPFAQLEAVEVGFPEGLGREYLGEGRCLLDGVDMFGAAPGRKARCGCTCPDLGENRSPTSINCWPLNYLHMNHFFVHLLWKQRALVDQCDYFMRVDGDMYLQKELARDPLTQLAPRTAEHPLHGRWPDSRARDARAAPRGNCVFLAERTNSDMAGCYEGQLEASLAWAAEAKARGLPVHPHKLRQSHAGSVYWGGWHAGNVSAFASEAHLEYAKWMMGLGGMYTRRWSDQVRWQGALLLLLLLLLLLTTSAATDALLRCFVMLCCFARMPPAADALPTCHRTAHA